MHHEYSEPETLVNSEATSTVGVDDKESLEEALLSSSKFLNYRESYERHAIKNPHSVIEEHLYPNFTGQTLMGRDKVNYRGDTFYFIDEKYFKYEDFNEVDGENFSVTFLHLGSKLSGHTGIIHGGLLATFLDEMTCRLAFQNISSKKGVTANLNINYRKPCLADNYVMIKCSIIKKIGRKCWVKGCVYTVDLDNACDIEDNENLAAECEVLVVEPRWVHKLSNTK
ncbi:uncharacterized protein PRCAT00003419001 [Priceomyces carsonii]|uniref:uncharacterized protein n=1 Tax=Priceomyces carsonii TaxID=28549 RepID=UPI002EDAF0B5|nr:unnamed protein product [Priceomyces carsonii]